MGRKKVKYGVRISIYLSNEAIAMLNKMTKTNRSSTIENCIRSCYLPEEKEKKEIDNLINTEVKEVINEQTTNL